MKKLFAFALCIAAVGSVSAQKSVVENAKKLSGKPEKIEEARAMLKEAMANPETAKSANTYFVAGNVEWDAYDKSLGKLAVNPNDESVNHNDMADQLLNGYKYFIEALPYDQLPNEKGQVKPMVTKKIGDKIAAHANDFWTVGAEMFNAKKYYPEAYEAFMTYGDIPTLDVLKGKNLNIPDSVRATSYFNAGLAAWSGEQVMAASKAFHKANEAGYNLPESYIYEIACWQNLAQSDSTLVDQAKNEIMSAARRGYEKFGIAQPIFINNMVNSLVSDNKNEEAVALVGQLLGENPGNANLYGLRGFIYDRMGNDDASVADYLAAAAVPDCDYETLKNAAKKLLRSGTEKLNDTEMTDKAAMKSLKDNYFSKAKEIADRAAAMQPGEPDLDYVLENINYALDSYFK